MFIEIISAGTAAISIIENRKTIIGALRRFRRRIFRGSWHVPVFGDGGTGKTTLGKLLAGELDIDVALEGYRETVDKETFSLPGDIPCILLVPPGQARKRPTTWPQLYRLLSSGKAGGIINVVSWGYRSTELEFSRHEVHRTGMSESEFRDAYLEYNRRSEIEALKEIVPHLKVAKGKVWMITLVTKQDLWWPERYNMEEYYKEGEYDEQIQEIIYTKGVENFPHNYFSVSLVPENLATKDGKIIERTASGYDQPLRIANIASFVKGLNDLLK